MYVSRLVVELVLLMGKGGGSRGGSRGGTGAAGAHGSGSHNPVFLALFVVVFVAVAGYVLYRRLKGDRPT